MIKNYFTVAVRNLSKNKVYVMLNTLGLGIAMACCMSAYLLIAYNIEFDDYFKPDEVRNVVKVLHHFKTPAGKQDKELVCPINIAPLAAQEISGIADFTRFCNTNGVMNYENNSFYENIRFADLSFLSMFTLELKYGTNKNFANRESVFLSKALAVKYFPEKDPVGEIMSVELNGKKYLAVVGGVFEHLPLNISFNIDALMRMETYLDAYSIGQDDWENGRSSSVLFRLTDIDKRDDIGKQMNKYVKLSNERQKESKTVSYELVSFSTPILKEEVRRSDLRLPIPTIALVIFSTLGFIILLIACFNLTNTTMALTGKRLKEIGIRKVVGSGRAQIAFQFLFEMVITILLALITGFVMAQFIVPKFALMWQLQYGLHDLNGLNLVMTLIILLFCAAILAGIYPALFNSKFSPLTLFKGGSPIKGTPPLMRTLLVIQFSLSVIVFIAGITFIRNATYQQQMSMGYDKESILTVSVQGDQEYDRLKRSIEGNPKIESIAGAGNHIGPYNSAYKTMRIDTTQFKTNVYEVGVNYFNTVGLTVKSGRDFLEGSQLDLESAIVIDENFAVNHGMANRTDARIWYNDKAYTIIGVVSNHLGGFKEYDNSEHVYIVSSPSNYSTMVLRTDPGDLLTVQRGVEKEWKKLFPGRPFQSNTQEEIVYEEAGGYNSNLNQILLFLTVMSCLLSASGIYALASLHVQRRAKEIGVRKVLGANVASIIKLLNKDFAIILAVAALIGGGGGYFLTDSLLDSLGVQHVDVGFITVSLCGLIITVVGLAATSGTIFKAAITNPTETLKSQ